jgi:hypothetical protein
MPTLTLTKIKKRKLLEAHHIQAIEDHIIDGLRNGDGTERDAVMLAKFESPGGSEEQTVLIVVEEKDITRLRKKLQSTLQ